MNLIIVGCGRMGAELALVASSEAHRVVVLDVDNRAFERLGAPHTIRTVQGSALERDVLEQADIGSADGLAAVTSDDATNFVVARMASQIFHIKNVVARVFNPERLSGFGALGVQAVASSSWGAETVRRLLTHPGTMPLASVGHGEISIAEITAGTAWAGRPIDALSQICDLVICGLVRGGKARLPKPGTKLEKDDLVVLSVRTEDLPKLMTQMASDGEA